MILVFGGTTEGKLVASSLDEANISYLYSTKTKVAFNGNGLPINGPLMQSQIEQLCAQENIKCIINASHPFAEELHTTIANLISTSL